VELEASAGWCAPSDAVLDMLDPVGIRHWPAGLQEDDLTWLAEMLRVAEIDPEPIEARLEIPTFSVRRGGIAFPVRGEDGPA